MKIKIIEKKEFILSEKEIKTLYHALNCHICDNKFLTCDDFQLQYDIKIALGDNYGRKKNS